MTTGRCSSAVSSARAAAVSDASLAAAPRDPAALVDRALPRMRRAYGLNETSLQCLLLTRLVVDAARARPAHRVEVLDPAVSSSGTLTVSAERAWSPAAPATS